MESKGQVERVPLSEAGAFLHNIKRKDKEDGSMYRLANRFGGGGGTIRTSFLFGPIFLSEIGGKVCN